jgi:N-acetylmuramoyl-L-alanine amidase
LGAKKYSICAWQATPNGISLELNSSAMQSCAVVKAAVSTFILLATLLVVAPFASSATRPSDRSPAARRQYVRISDWAQANQFAVRWLDQDRTLQLSNRWGRLVFNVDPRLELRKTQVNGVEVWLSYPILYQKGVAHIAQDDLEQTLAPLLSPPVGRSGKKIKTICLDPGHGGKDPGYRVGTNEEQRYNLLLAQEVRDQLQQAGFNVVLTRNSDAFVPLENRPAIARKSGADLFISLHFNSSEEARTTVRGVEIYCCTPAGATSFNSTREGDTRWVTGNRNDDRNMLLAYLMQKSYVRSLQVEDRGVKRARYQVLRDATMPAVLIEGGFMSNPVEGKKIFDPTYRRQMARAVVDGVLAYQRAVKG